MPRDALGGAAIEVRIVVPHGGGTPLVAGVADRSVGSPTVTMTG
jgi:hypothetical protein